MKSNSRRRVVWLTALSMLVGFAVIGSSVFADARTEYLVRALRTSSMFRVRAQAALSLGAAQNEPQVTRALTDALRDAHPAVRAAACSSLRRQGDPSALPALQRMSRDRESAVRRACAAAAEALERVRRSQPQSRTVPPSGGGSSGSAPRGSARYYVAVGVPATKVRGIDRATLTSARQLISRTTGAMDGVQLAPANESARAARRAVGGMTGYYLDSSIVAVEQTAQGLRARVSVVVQSYPDRNIRSMLQGAATVPGGRGATARRQAIEGALRGALRNLPQAMAASARPQTASSGGRRGRRRRR